MSFLPGNIFVCAVVASVSCLSCGGGGGDDSGTADAAFDAVVDTASLDVEAGDALHDATGRDSGLDGIVSHDDYVSDQAAPDDVPDTASDTASDSEETDVDVQCDPVVYDMAMIQDPSDINCVFSNHRTVMKDAALLDLWDVSYTSWESIDCKLVPITIRGFAAKPAAASGAIPGVAHMHGLGGCADPDNATGPAALLGAFVIAPTGPGGGPSENAPDCAASEGRPSGYDSGYRMFDTIPDPRGSWFWGHSVAAMRGLTCLATRAEVDSSRLGATGFSAGAVATLIASSVDSRVKAAVSLSGTGAWGIATQSVNAWQHQLLTLAGLDTSSPEWQTLISTLLPDVNMAGSTAKILMVNGSSDEFFPLTAHMATFNSIPGTDKRTAIVANYDHGCCILVDKLCGLEDIADIEARATLAASGNQRAWFAHWFGTDSDFGYYPSTPEVSLNVVGGATYVMAAVDGGGSKLDVDGVKIWASNDGALNFFSQSLSWNDTLKLWDATVPLVIGGDAVYYLEVTYSTDAILLPDRFILSSIPHLPDGFIPVIHPMDDCVP